MRTSRFRAAAVAVLAAAAALWLLAPVLTPFLAAVLLAYLGDPLIDRLQALRLPRTAAVALVFLFLLALIAGLPLLLVPLLEQQVGALLRHLPEWPARLREALPPWLAGAGAEALPDPDRLAAMLKANWKEAGGLAFGLLGAVSRSGLALLGWLVNLVLIPVVTFYLLRDWDRLLERLRGLLPAALEPRLSALAREADDILGAFLRGQLLVMAALAAVYSLGLRLIGLDLALLVVLVAGLVSFVPYLGFILGMLLAGGAALVQFQEALPLLYVLAVFGAGQLLESLVLTPRLVGERLGLHPVAVIFAVLAGGHLFGFFGVLLALPAASVAMVLLRHVRHLSS